MKFVTLALIILLTAGCEEEDMEKNCTSTVDCSDDREMICDEPVRHVYENGDSVEIKACSYITYENCFESIVCKEQ